MRVTNFVKFTIPKPIGWSKNSDNPHTETTFWVEKDRDFDLYYLCAENIKNCYGYRSFGSLEACLDYHRQIPFEVIKQG
jgi:hypothetical protein